MRRHLLRAASKHIHSTHLLTKNPVTITHRTMSFRSDDTSDITSPQRQMKQQLSLTYSLDKATAIRNVALEKIQHAQYDVKKLRRDNDFDTRYLLIGLDQLCETKDGKIVNNTGFNEFWYMNSMSYYFNWELLGKTLKKELGDMSVVKELQKECVKDDRLLSLLNKLDESKHDFSNIQLPFRTMSKNDAHFTKNAHADQLISTLVVNYNDLPSIEYFFYTISSYCRCRMTEFDLNKIQFYMFYYNVNQKNQIEKIMEKLKGGEHNTELIGYPDSYLTPEEFKIVLGNMKILPAPFFYYSTVENVAYNCFSSFVQLF